MLIVRPPSFTEKAPSDSVIEAIETKYKGHIDKIIEDFAKEDNFENTP